MDSPAGVRPVVKQQLQQVLDMLYDKNGNLHTDPEMLYGVRQGIGDMLSKTMAAKYPGAQLAKSQLMEVQSALDKVIEPAAPGFGKLPFRLSSSI